MSEILAPNGKIAGYIQGNTFYTVREPNMYMIKFRGFGISMSVLRQLMYKGITDIHLTYNGVKGIKVYHQKVEDYLDSEQIYYYKGEDKQMFVSVDKGSFNSGFKDYTQPIKLKNGQLTLNQVKGGVK